MSIWFFLFSECLSVIVKEINICIDLATHFSLGDDKPLSIEQVKQVNTSARQSKWKTEFTRIGQIKHSPVADTIGMHKEPARIFKETISWTTKTSKNKVSLLFKAPDCLDFPKECTDTKMDCLVRDAAQWWLMQWLNSY